MSSPIIGELPNANASLTHWQGVQRHLIPTPLALATSVVPSRPFHTSTIMSAQAPAVPPPTSSSGTDYSGLVQGSTDPTDQHLVIRQIIPGMLTFSLPFVRITLWCHLNRGTHQLMGGRIGSAPFPSAEDPLRSA